MRLTFDCVTAATLPTVMVMADSTQNNRRQSAFIDGIPSTKIRINIAKDAAFEPTDRNAVIGVGAPSYTSGAHMWNGTAAILNPTPATTRITASTRRRSLSCPANSGAIARRLVVPDRPYMIDMPYSRIPSEKAPSRKY